MTNPQSNSDIRAAAYKAMDAYLDAGGSTELIITSKEDYERNFEVSMNIMLSTERKAILAATYDLPKEPMHMYSSQSEEYIKGFEQALDTVRKVIEERDI